MDRRQRQQAKGFTLIEMMLSLALGALFIGGVISVFISGNKNYDDNMREARLQGNGRAALYILSNELRHANFWGPLLTLESVNSLPAGALTQGPCLNWASSDLSNSPLVASDTPKTSTFFTTSCLDDATDDETEIKDGTSAFAIKRVSNSEVDITDSDYKDDTVYLRIFSTGGAINVKDSSTNAPANGFSDWRYEPKIYFIRSHWNVDDQDGIPTLCTVRIDPAAPDELQVIPLVAGVESMHIEYGIDTDGDGIPNEYQTAPADADIGDTAVVKIYLLIRDDETDWHYDNTKTYNLGTKSITVNDNYRRAVFNTSIIPHNLRG